MQRRISNLGVTVGHSELNEEEKETDRKGSTYGQSAIKESANDSGPKVLMKRRDPRC